MLLLSILLTAAHPAPKQSVQALVSSNGHGTLAWNVAEKRFDRLLQHPYKFESNGVATRDLLVDAYFGVTLTKGATNAKTWLPSAAVESVAYVPGTAIIVAKQKVEGVTVTTYGFVPRGLSGAAFVMLAQIENTSGAALSNVSLYSLVNQRLGAERPEPSGANEYIQYNLGKVGFEEFGPYMNSGAAAVARPLGGVSRRTSGAAGIPTNPWNQLNAGMPFSDEVGDSGSVTGYNGNDLASGYQWQIGALAAGEKAWAGVAVSYDQGSIAADAWGRLDDWLKGVTAPADLLARETATWADTSAAKAPAGMSADEQALYRQSLAVLKMAQVRESGRSYGQILASPAASTSNEYNQWNITWVRDMAYATVALAEAGAFAEAKAALEFQLRAQAGTFAAPEFVGHDYQISVCRYFGDGSEESDSNADGPNIEYDGFGLFLWALGRYVALSGDVALAQTYLPLIQTKIADVLIALVEPYSGLVRADSSIWETHWNGKQRQFAYSSITAASGICAMGDVAQALGDADGARRYRNIARQLRKSIRDHLFDAKGVLAASKDELERGSDYYDAAVLEAFAMKLFDPNGAEAHATVDALLEKLSIAGGRGLFRNDEGGDYDKQEWVLVDLRLVAALAGSQRAEDAETATRLWSWVLSQSRANKDLIAELYDDDTTGASAHAYAGSVPMAGFGAGAYVLAAHQRFQSVTEALPCGGFSNEIETDATGEVKPEDAGDPPVEEQPTPAPDAKKRGCAGTTPIVWWVLAFMLWFAVRERR